MWYYTTVTVRQDLECQTPVGLVPATFTLWLTTRLDDPPPPERLAAWREKIVAFAPQLQNSTQAKLLDDFWGAMQILNVAGLYEVGIDDGRDCRIARLEEA